VIEYLAEDDASDIELPPDFVVREIADVELTPEALTAFTAKWGPLTGWGADRMFALPPVWGPDEVWWEINRLGIDRPWGGEGPRTTWMAPVSAIALHIRTLRILVSHLQLYLDPASSPFEDYEAAWRAHGFEATWRDDGFGDLPEEHRPAKRMDFEGKAWMDFDTIINAALRPFHANVQFYPGTTLTGSAPTPTLYQACALQLYNYIAEQAPIRRCARARCTNFFTVQRGRAQYGQHRKAGARYCSRGCAKAQSEQDRRNRQRAASR
jgi:hypothetical protein